MNNVHFTLQGKGGIGKSLISYVLAQYISEKSDIICIDTDPINKTFSGFKSLNVISLQIMKKGNIDQRKFDYLVQTILSSDSDIIIDNGSSSFTSLTSYIIENDVFSLLIEHNKNIFIHVIITGGQSFKYTTQGLKYIIDNFTEKCNIVVWKNGYFGDVSINNKDFEELEFYAKNKSKIFGIIPIPEMNTDTYGVDIKEMLAEGLTFYEFISSAEKMIMPKQRIKKFKDNVLLSYVVI